MEIMKVLDKKNAELKGEELQMLVASDGDWNDLFGHSVVISGGGSTIVGGSYGDDYKGTDSGSVYIFV